MVNVVEENARSAWMRRSNQGFMMHPARLGGRRRWGRDTPVNTATIVVEIDTEEEITEV